MSTTTNLSILDAVILAMDSPETPMHVGGACVFRPPAGAGPDHVKRLYDTWRRLDANRPPLNHRLAPRSLLNLRPAWETVEHVDLSGHFFRVALPSPGGPHELEELLGRLYTAPFDRSRPMWQIYLIEGLGRGRFAMYTKIHHALMDGVTAARILMAPLSGDPAARDSPPPWAAPREAGASRVSGPGRKPPPAGAEQAWTVHRMLREIGQLPSTITELKSLAEADVPAPDTILNRPITVRRFTGSVSLELDRIRKAGAPSGSTVNDVSLAVCGGALRRYLSETGQLPVDSLRALVPVSLAAAHETRGGNVATAITVPLGTDVEDPKRRLALITRATRAAKAALRDTTSELVTALRGVLLMAPAAAEQLIGVRLLGRPPYNLAISNVPGPARRLYLNGAQMEQIVPNFLVGPGMALSILLTSYYDRLGITVTACPDTVPGIDRIVPMLRGCFAELEVAVRKASRSRTRRR